MLAKGYAGGDVDFEYILASDRQAFTGFVAELAEVIHQLGYTLAMVLAPKTYTEQPTLRGY